MKKILTLLLCLCFPLAAAAAPSISGLGPTRQVLAPGESSTLSVTATGSGALAYQWIHNGRPVTGATSGSLQLPTAAQADAGWYCVDVADANGTTRSAPLFVLVAPVVTQARSWGLSSSSAAPLYALSDVIALDLGVSGGHLALRRDGTVLGWGVGSINSVSTPLAPAGLTDIVAVAAGALHGLALKSDGTVVAWGENALGQATVPAGLNNVVAIAAGYYHSLALRSDGTVVAWGDNSMGQRNLPSGLQNVVGIAAGETHSLAVKADGTVVAWNYDAQGQSSVPAGLSGVVSVAAGPRYSVALKSDGTMVAWGSKPPGQAPATPALSAVAAGGFFTVGLGNDGSVVGWGNSFFGEVPSDLHGAYAIAISNFFAVALRDGAGDLAPSVTVPPASITVTEPQSASFSVAATGTGPFAYQWRKNGVPIANATGSTLTIDETSPSDAATYDVVVSNHIGSATSAGASLTITPLAVVTSLTPPRQVVALGQPLELGVTATGTGALSYQWYKNSRPLPGATTSSFSVPSSTRADDGYYWVKITDDVGTRQAATIFVTVAPAVTQVVSWGENATGTSAVPGGLSGVVRLADGGGPIAIKQDGSLAVWGYAATQAPAGLTEVVAVAVGQGQTLALKADGTVVAWGSNIVGQATVPAGLKDVVEIAAGFNFSLALKRDGSVVGWGSSYQSNGPFPPGASGIKAAQYSAIGIKADNTVLVWGSSQTYTPPSDLTNVTKVTTGSSHSMALKSDGTAVAWGDNGYGKTSVPAGLTGVVDIAAGAAFSTALKSDGTLAKWGEYSDIVNPPLGLDHVFSISTDGFTMYALRDAVADQLPTVTSHPQGVLRAIGGTQTFSVTASGPAPLAYQWRKNGVALAGKTGRTLTLDPLQPADAADYDVVVSNYVGSVTSNAATLSLEAPPAVVSASTRRILGQPGQPVNFSVSATSANGPLTYRWTLNNRPIPGALSATYSVPAFANANAGAYTLEIMDAHGLVTRESFFVLPSYGRTEVVAWGGNNNGGQLSVPAGLDTAVAISAGSSHSLALLADGTVRGWGGTLPGNSFNQAVVPAGLTDVVAVAGGAFHSLALKSDGTVVGWGYNINGALDIPAGLSDVIAIAAPSAFSMALKSDGTVVTWGSDVPGLLTVPDSLSDVVAISGGHQYALALKSDGTVLQWGTGDNGLHGVPSGTASSMAGGSAHALRIKPDGSVDGWGSNINGGIIPPAGLANVVQVSAGGDYSVALKADGTVVAWGVSYQGQLNIPVGLNGVVAISAGGQHILALRDVGSLYFAQHPQSQQVLAERSVTFTASADGALTFQWRKDGVDIPGAVAASYTIGNVQAGDAGEYSVVAANAGDSVLSAVAVLTVLPARPPTFDALGYLARNGDVAAGIGDVPDKLDQAWSHYYLYGIGEGRTDGDFNVQAYMAQYPGVGSDVRAAAVYWYTTGRKNGDRIPVGFSVAGYFLRNSDIAAIFANDKYGAWLHYYNYGVFEGRSYDANFIVDEYLELNPDLKGAFGTNKQEALMHWLTWGHPVEDRMGRVPIGFNVDSYLARYPDLQAVFGDITPKAVRNVTVWHHYVAYGTLEGRTDGDFEAYNYLATNPDLAAVFGSDIRAAALHWFFYGRREGRRIPGGFDVADYRVRYPDIVVGLGDDLYGSWLHYRDTGVNEGRVFGDLFRPADYLALNPDVAAVIGNNYRDALLHWLYYGQFEGRPAKY